MACTPSSPWNTSPSNCGFKAFNPEQEFVTMSMGKLGRLSRFAGDLVGSSWTFASLDNASAPGQVGLADMRRIREILDAD